MKKRYSIWSALLGVICIINLFASYAIAPDQPRGIMIILLRGLFFTSILSGILSLILTYLSFQNKEEGFLKKLAPIIILSILLMFALSIIGIIVSIGDIF